jgi:hypothetical protein
MEVQKKGDARQQARTSVSFDSKIEHHWSLNMPLPESRWEEAIELAKLIFQNSHILKKKTDRVEVETIISKLVIGKKTNSKLFVYSRRNSTFLLYYVSAVPKKLQVAMKLFYVRHR